MILPLYISYVTIHCILLGILCSYTIACSEDRNTSDVLKGSPEERDGVVIDEKSEVVVPIESNEEVHEACDNDIVGAGDPSVGHSSAGSGDGMSAEADGRAVPLKPSVALVDVSILHPDSSELVGQQPQVFSPIQSASQQKPTERPDFLSYSPSLADIFAFLNPEDIRNCKTLSRRLTRVISHHPRSMPRDDVYLTVRDLEKPIWQFAASRWKDGRNEEDTYHIHDNSVKCRRSGQEGFSLIKETSSREDGASFLIAMFCRNYSTTIDLVNYLYPPIPLSFLELISKICRECQGCYCSQLVVDCEDDLQKISSLIDTKLMALPLWGEPEIAQLRPLFESGTCRRLELTVLNPLDDEAEDCLEFHHQYIVGYVKDWALHDYRLPRVSVASQEESWVDPDGTLGRLLLELDGCQHFEKSDTEDGALYSYRFSRPADHRLLLLQYLQSDIIYFYDCEPTWPIEFCKFE